MDAALEYYPLQPCMHTPAPSSPAPRAIFGSSQSWSWVQQQSPPQPPQSPPPLLLLLQEQARVASGGMVRVGEVAHQLGAASGLCSTHAGGRGVGKQRHSQHPPHTSTTRAKASPAA